MNRTIARKSSRTTSTTVSTTKKPSLTTSTKRKYTSSGNQNRNTSRNSRRDDRQQSNLSGGPRLSQTAIPFDKVPVKFTDLGIAPELAETLYQQGIVAPSTIQKQSIPAILQGGDVCITAQTGQGKTLAYSLPLIQRLVEDESLGKVSLPSTPRAIILVPTRELAMQVEKTTKALSHTMGYRLKSKAITGDQSPSEMRGILRGEDSNDSIRILNTTEAKIRDQIRLAATVASRVVNSMFKEHSWSYQRLEGVGKKMNRKVQEQRREAAEDGKAAALGQVRELESKLRAMNVVDMEEGIDENESEIPGQNEEIAKIKKQLTQQRRLLLKYNQELVQLDKIAENWAKNAPDGTNTTTTRNWPQIKRSIKRETTRFAYALFAVAQDKDDALDRLNELGSKGKKGKKNGTNIDEAHHGDGTAVSIHHRQFVIPAADLESKLNTAGLFQAEPLAVRTIANELVTTLAQDHLHDTQRADNSVNLPVPLMKTSTSTYTPSQNLATMDEEAMVAAATKNSAKPIKVLLPTRDQIGDDTKLRHRNKKNKGDDVFDDEHNFDDFGDVQFSDDDGNVDEMRAAFEDRDTEGKDSASNGKKSNCAIMDINSTNNHLIHRTAQLDSENDIKTRVAGDYLILNRFAELSEAQLDQIDTFTQNDQNDQNSTGLRHKKNHFSALDDQDSSNSFFLDVDYITKITLQSLEAMAPGIVKFIDTSPTDADSDDIIGSTPATKTTTTTTTPTHTQPLSISYSHVAQHVQDYVANLPTTELLDLSLSSGTDFDEDAFLHNEARTNDPAEYQRSAALYHKNRLQRNLDILICTPSRMIQLIQWRAIKLGKVNYVVLDEADLLLTSRTHIPQNVKTAFAQMTKDQKQNVSKHLDTDSKAPINQVINDLQIRNGELYQAMVPLLTRMKGEFELNHGYIPHVKTPNTIFRHGFSAPYERKESDFHKGHLLAKEKQIKRQIATHHPNVPQDSPQFQQLYRQYQEESVVSDQGIPLSETNLDSTVKKTLAGELVAVQDDNGAEPTAPGDLPSLPIHSLKSLKTRIAEYEGSQKDLDDLQVDGETLGGETKTEIEKYLKLSKNVEPIQFIYTSATLSSHNTQFHQEITKINPLYGEQFSPRQLIQTTTEDALCLPTSLKQTFVQVGNRDKLHILTEILSSPDLSTTRTFFPTQTMVFCNTIASARAVAHTLAEKGVSCASVHSGVPPRHRADNWENFFNNKIGVMVATDIASRGVHHPSIRYIINFDFPLSPVDYLHRAGRATTLPGQVGSMRTKTKEGTNSSRAITENTQFITVGGESVPVHDDNVDGYNDDDDGNNNNHQYNKSKHFSSQTRHQPSPDEMNEAYATLDKTDQRSGAPGSDGLQAVVLDHDGRPVQKRGEVISLVNKADQVLAYAINEATKQLSPITALSADKKDYSVKHNQEQKHHHDSARQQSRDEERVLTSSSKEFIKAKDKLVRSLQGTDVYMGGQKVTNAGQISSALRKAAKEHILHRDRFSNVGEDKRKVDRTSDRRRAEARYVQQQTDYAATMGFNKPLLTKTSKINAQYPDRILDRKIEQSLQGMREKSYKNRQREAQHDRFEREANRNAAQKYASFGQQGKGGNVSRRTPDFAQHNDDIPQGMGKSPTPETRRAHNNGGNRPRF